MAIKAVAAAPEAISEESAKTHIADRPTETQAVVRTRHADGTTGGNAPFLAGESQQNAEHISHAPADKIGLHPVHATPDQPVAQEPNAAKRSQALDSNAPGSQPLVPDESVSVTLSEPDKVRDAVVPLWTKFADLTIEEKFAQARLMDFGARDTYLRERCRAAKLEVAYAASALDRATAIIETNLPFFFVHFDDIDAQGNVQTLGGRFWARLSGFGKICLIFRGGRSTLLSML